MRIKDDKNSLTKNLILFPDASTIMLNNKLLKEFIPLHRQSSLKFRKDEVFTIKNSLISSNNKIIINERLESEKKDWKSDERI